MKLKLIAKSIGFSRIKIQKPNIVLETGMNESAFKSLRNGLEAHLHGRVIFKKGSASSEVTLRGLSPLPIEQQVETLIEWLDKMAKQLPAIENQICNSITEKFKQE